jgi:hypothetical protein
VRRPQLFIAQHAIFVYPEAKITRFLREDRPEIYIARWHRWQEWSHQINMDEFASLVGLGPWYWDEKQAAEQRKKVAPAPESDVEPL